MQHDNPAWLPDDVIMRRLRMIRYSPRRERQAHRAPSLNAIATAIGAQPAHLYTILSGRRPLTDRLRLSLSLVLSHKE